MAEQVIIEFVGDTSKLEPAIDILAKAGQVSEKDAAAFKKLNTEGSKAMAGVNAGSKTAIKSLGDVEKSAKKLATTFEDEVAAGIKDALDEAGVTVDEFTAALEKSGGSMQDIVDETKKVVSSTSSLKKEYKDTVAQLAQLKLAGQTNSKQYQELRERAGELKDTLADVNEEVGRAGSDTRGFDNLIQIASGVTAGFAIAQGSMALFGDEGEEIQKTLLKVNAAMAILQGLQQLQAIAAQKNFQSLTALVGIETIETIQTNLQTAAESKNIIVRYAAIAAQKALNAVMAISPLGLIALAVAAIAAAWALFSSKAGNAIEIQKRLNAQLDSSLDLYDRNIEAIKNTTDITVKRLESELKTRKEISAAAQEGLEMQIEQARQIKRQADDNYAIAFKAFGLKKKLNDDESKEFEAANNKKIQADQKFYSLQRELASNDLEQQKQDLEDSIKSHQAFVDAKVLASQKGSIAEIDAQIAAAKAAEETTKKLNPDLTAGDLEKLAADTNRQLSELNAQRKIKVIENEKAIIGARLAITREGSVEELELEKQRADKDVQIQLASIELSQQKRKEVIAEGAKEQLEFARQIRDRRLQFDLDEINGRINLAKEGSAEEFSAHLDALRKQEEIDLNAKGLTDSKRLDLEAKYQKDVLALTRQFNAQVQTEAISTKQAETNQKLAALQRADVSENNAELLKLKKDAIEEQAQLDIVAAHASINNEELLAEKIKEIRAKAKADKLAIDQDAAVKEIDFAKNLANAELEIEKTQQQKIVGTFGFRIKARQDASVKILQIEKQELQNEFDALEEKHKRGLISEEDYQLQLAALRQRAADIDTAITEKQEQQKREIIQAGFQILTDAVSTFYDIQATKRQQDLDNQLAALELRKQTEVDNKNLTESQKANIEERYNQKANALKRKAFEADKQAKKQQAVISGALAVVNALATAPTIIAGIILAAVVAASTAFQIAKINATQPPAFKKGTKKAPRGYAWVGEEGPELTYLKGGERIYTTKQSIQIADAWRGGSLAHADDILMGNIATPNNEILSAISVNNYRGTSLTKEDITEAMEEALQSMKPSTVNQINMDQEGFTTYIMKEMERQRVLNRRYTIK